MQAERLGTTNPFSPIKADARRPRIVRATEASTMIEGRFRICKKHNEPLDGARNGTGPSEIRVHVFY